MRINIRFVFSNQDHIFCIINLSESERYLFVGYFYNLSRRGKVSCSQLPRHLPCSIFAIWSRSRRATLCRCSGAWVSGWENISMHSNTSHIAVARVRYVCRRIAGVHKICISGIEHVRPERFHWTGARLFQDNLFELRASIS